jgi:hypothetical protein
MKKHIFSVFIVLFSILISLSCPNQIFAASVPLLGTIYTHYRFPNGSMDNGGIILSYANQGVRDQVRSQLSQMKNAGVQTLNLDIWHMWDDPQPWGVVSSRGGRISDPYRTNLINFLTDVKQAGFSRLLITFCPMWKNSPGNYEGPGQYDPARFEENWEFIQDIRSIAKQYGPANIIFDLLGEGAPSSNWPDYQQVYNYDVELWQLYVDKFGKSDATISLIADSYWNNNRLENLISIYNTSGRAFPDWFYISFYVKDNVTIDEAYSDLEHIDQVLTANNLLQSLRVRETWYNSTIIAEAIKKFNSSHTRQVEEIMQWFIGMDNPSVLINPPYNVDVYMSAFGIPKPTPTQPSCSLRSQGDANCDGKVDMVDYYYLVHALNGGTLPSSVNPDFNGDGEIGLADRTIIVKTLHPI